MKKSQLKFFRSPDHQFNIVCGRGISKRYPMHRHLSICIGLIINGYRLLKIGAKTYIINKGDIFIINSHEAHAIGENTERAHDYIVVSISKELIVKTFGNSNFVFDNIIESPDINKILKKFFDIVFHDCNDNLDIHSLVAMMSRFQKPIISSVKSNAVVQKISQLLDRDPFSPHLLESLAEQAFLSPFHFSRLFKRHTGLAPHQYLLNNRLRHARMMLESNYSVSDIAIACGFYDSSHFIRHYIEYNGISPQDYQKSVR